MVRIKGAMFFLTALGIVLAPTNTIAKSTSLIAFASVREGNPQVYVMHSDGEDVHLITTHIPGNNFGPSWSPDGQRIAFSSWSGQSDIYVINADGTNPIRLTRHPGDEGEPRWSPDGQHIAFGRMLWRNSEVFVMDPDGGNLRNLTNHQAPDTSPSWSPDGQQIAFQTMRDGLWKVYVMDADGNNQRNLTRHDGSDMQPSWSPDGRQIALKSDQGIYVMDVDGRNRRFIAEHTTYGAWPCWSPDSSQIAFTSERDENQEIYVVDAASGRLTRLTKHPAGDWGSSWYDPSLAQSVTSAGRLATLWSRIKH